MYVPYLDKDVFDFLSSIESRMFADGTFHTDTIARAFGDYSDIPYSSHSAAASPGRMYYIKYLLELMLFMTRHSSNMVRNGSFKRLLKILTDSSYRELTRGFSYLIIYLSQLNRYIR